MIKPEELLHFAGPDWKVLKIWLNEQRAHKISRLIISDNQIESDKTRGSIAMIDSILALEIAAAQAAQRKLNG